MWDQFHIHFIDENIKDQKGQNIYPVFHKWVDPESQLWLIMKGNSESSNKHNSFVPQVLVY